MKNDTLHCLGTGQEDKNRSSHGGPGGIGLVLIVAVGLVQPIGVSAQYVVLDGVLLHYVLPDVTLRSSYLAKTAQGWTLATYEFFFVLGIPFGALMAAMATARFRTRVVPVEWRRRFGSNPESLLVCPSSVDFYSSSAPASAAAAPRGT